MYAVLSVLEYPLTFHMLRSVHTKFVVANVQQTGTL